MEISQEQNDGINIMLFLKDYDTVKEIGKVLEVGFEQ